VLLHTGGDLIAVTVHDADVGADEERTQLTAKKECHGLFQLLGKPDVVLVAKCDIGLTAISYQFSKGTVGAKVLFVPTDLKGECRDAFRNDPLEPFKGIGGGGIVTNVELQMGMSLGVEGIQKLNEPILSRIVDCQ
jgi:hypothetical protein